MKRKELNIIKTKLEPFSILAEQWMILSAGDFTNRNFNFMTIAWGSFGTMWFKPFVMVVVRPPRHTFSFMENSDSFTVSAFPDEFRDDLTFCGKNSGRDTDKVKSTKLTPEASKKISAPSFKEAELILECKKIYFDDFRPENFIDSGIEQYYPAKDYHRIYFGEVLYAEGTEKYS